MLQTPSNTWATRCEYPSAPGIIRPDFRIWFPSHIMGNSTGNSKTESVIIDQVLANLAHISYGYLERMMTMRASLYKYIHSPAGGDFQLIELLSVKADEVRTV